MCWNKKTAVYFCTLSYILVFYKKSIPFVKGKLFLMAFMQEMCVSSMIQMFRRIPCAGSSGSKFC
jgi:hypothetical protein